MDNRSIASTALIILAFLIACPLLGQQAQIPVPPIQAEPNMPGPNDLPARPELPDPLVTNAGQRVTTVAQWQAHREEMKRVLSHYAVGLMPPPPGNVKGQDLKTASLLDGKVNYRLVHLSFGPQQGLGFDVAIFTPTDRQGPLPTVIFPSFDLTPGAAPLTCMPRRPEQGKGLDALSLPLGIPEAQAAVQSPAAPDPGKTAEAYAWLFKRGYGLVTYHYQDCGEDTIARNADGSWAFRNTRFFPAYPGYNWRLLGAWAWGISRCIDYLEGQAFANRSQLIAVGHSRIGKAVLVAGAFDERIALSAPAGSAGGGVGAYRFAGKGRGGGEGLDDMMRKYPNWFSPHLHAFARDPEKLPFDQHWFIALTAPRGFIALEGTGDNKICSPAAVKASIDGAAPVYALLGSPGGATSNYGEHGHALTEDDWGALLDRADRHRASPKTFDVRSIGAAGNGTTKDTAVFQKAIDECSAAGGGAVMAPAGDFLIGAIALKSNVTLVLEQGATLIGSPDINDYPLARIRWEGRWEQGHCALIHAEDASHIAITGPGRITGDKVLGRRRNPRGPALIEPIHCNDVRFEGFSATHTNMWMIHPTRCNQVVAKDLTLRSTGGNGDGIDIDSCKDVRVEGCDIDTGDDAIAIKSGRGMEGLRGAEPSEDIVILRCVLGDSNFACIGIGSEMSGSVRNVRIEDCTFTHARTNAIYIKSRPGRGGVIENITARNLEVKSCTGAFLRINLLQSGKQDPEPVPGFQGIPQARHLSFANVRLNDCGGLVEATLIPSERPVEQLSLIQVSGQCKKGMTLAHLRDVRLDMIEVTGYEGPLLAIQDVTGTGLEGAVPLN